MVGCMLAVHVGGAFCLLFIVLYQSVHLRFTSSPVRLAVSFPVLILILIFSQMLDLLLAGIVLVNFPNKWALFDATASASIFKSSLVKFGLGCVLVAISRDMLNVGLAKVGQLSNTCTRCRLRGDDAC